MRKKSLIKVGALVATISMLFSVSAFASDDSVRRITYVNKRILGSD